MIGGSAGGGNAVAWAGRRHRTVSAGGFTLLELLVAFTVLTLILVLLVSTTSHVTAVVGDSRTSFQEARTAFETMNRVLSQAVLNTYWDYDSVPDPRQYMRASELHFVVGPADELTGLSGTSGGAVFCQAPLGVVRRPELKGRTSLLNTVGFYVRYSESADVPEFLSATKPATAGYRLWMYLEPAEDLSVFSEFNARPQAPSSLAWFRAGMNSDTHHHVLGNHIVWLLIRCTYRDAAGNTVVSYAYDSRPGPGGGPGQQARLHQFPSALQLTLLAIDERSAIFLRGQGAFPFVPDELFQDAAEYAGDMVLLKKHLDNHPDARKALGYRIFESTVDIGSAKWSL